MSCEYGFYKDDETYYPRIYCKLNDKMCAYSYRCTRYEKYLQTENWKECYLYNMEMVKNIPNGSYLVQTYRPNKKGKLILYILIDDNITRVQSNLTELNQNYVYLKDDLDGYEVSLKPFEIKRNYTRKKVNEEKRD